MQKKTKNLIPTISHLLVAPTLWAVLIVRTAHGVFILAISGGRNSGSSRVMPNLSRGSVSAQASYTRRINFKNRGVKP